MVTFRAFALLAAATFVVGQTIDTFPPCAQTCYNDVKNDAGKYNCGADDLACLCKVQDFKNGVDDCTKAACPADVAPGFIVAVNALCATAAPAAPTPEPTTSAPSVSIPAVSVSVSSTVAPPPTATTEPTTSVTPEPVPSTTSETPAAVSSTSPTSSATPESTTTPAVSTTASTSGTAAATPSPSTTSPNSEAKPSSTPESDKSSEPAGLAAGAKAGIGIGVAAAVIALLGVAYWASTRQRRITRAKGFSSKHMIKISDSSPGGGRGFGNDQHYETGLSELEMKSRRYEDMIPRQEPRHMV